MSLLLLFRRHGPAPSVSAPSGGAAGGGGAKKKYYQKEPKWRDKKPLPKFRKKRAPKKKIPLEQRKFVALRRADRLLKALETEFPAPRKKIPIKVIKQILEDLSPLERPQRKIVSMDIIRRLLAEPKRIRRVLKIKVPDLVLESSIFQDEHLVPPAERPLPLDLVALARALQPTPLQKITPLPPDTLAGITARKGITFEHPYAEKTPQVEPLTPSVELLTLIAIADNEEELAMFLIDPEFSFAD